MMALKVLRDHRNGQLGSILWVTGRMLQFDTGILQSMVLHLIPLPLTKSSIGKTSLCETSTQHRRRDTRPTYGCSESFTAPITIVSLTHGTLGCALLETSKRSVSFHAMQLVASLTWNLRNYNSVKFSLHRLSKGYWEHRDTQRLWISIYTDAKRASKILYANNSGF